MLSRVVRPFVRIAQRGTRQYHADGKAHKYATMNELPVPSGSWQAQYDANQKRYNLHLAIGIVALVASFTLAKSTGSLYLNAFPPTPKDEK